jgi:tetratricopeptide (TPR) repeat protein
VNRALRAIQREGMNPKALDEYVAAGGERKGRGLFYAAQEHASAGRLKVAIRRMVTYLKTNDGFHEQVYEAHLMLAEWLLHLKHPRLAIRVAKRGLQFNIQRSELEMLLGDLHVLIGDLETARQCYAKAAGVPMPNHSLLFLRTDWYRHLPWRGLSHVCYRLEEHVNALRAAQAGLSYADDDVCRQIVDHLQGAPVG